MTTTNSFYDRLLADFLPLPAFHSSQRIMTFPLLQ